MQYQKNSQVWISWLVEKLTFILTDHVAVEILWDCDPLLTSDNTTERMLNGNEWETQECSLEDLKRLKDDLQYFFSVLPNKPSH